MPVVPPVTIVSVVSVVRMGRVVIGVGCETVVSVVSAALSGDECLVFSQPVFQAPVPSF